MANLTTTDLDNGKTDLETLSTVVNSQTESTTSTRLGDTVKTVKGLTDEFEQAIINSGYQVLGSFASGITITSINQVLDYDGGLYRTTEALPYTTDGATPDLDSGEWVVVSDGVLSGIARSLNALDSEIIYSTDTATILDNVIYIYDASAQTAYHKPRTVGTSETILLIAGLTLTTTANTYSMRLVSSPSNMVVRPIDEGCKGDGITVDTEGMQMALNKIWDNGGGTLDLGDQSYTYLVDDTLFYRVVDAGNTDKSISIIGDNAKILANHSGDVLDIQGAFKVKLDSFSIDGGDTSNIGLLVAGANNTIVTDNGGNTGSGKRSEHVVITNVDVQHVSQGASFGSANDQLDYVSVLSSYFKGSSGGVLVEEGNTYATFVETAAHGNGTADSAWKINNGQAKLIDCYAFSSTWAMDINGNNPITVQGMEGENLTNGIKQNATSTTSFNTKSNLSIKDSQLFLTDTSNSGLSLGGFVGATVENSYFGGELEILDSTSLLQGCIYNEINSYFTSRDSLYLSSIDYNLVGAKSPDADIATFESTLLSKSINQNLINNSSAPNSANAATVTLNSAEFYGTPNASHKLDFTASVASYLQFRCGTEVLSTGWESTLQDKRVTFGVWMKLDDSEVSSVNTQVRLWGFSGAYSGTTLGRKNLQLTKTWKYYILTFDMPETITEAFTFAIRNSAGSAVSVNFRAPMITFKGIHNNYYETTGTAKLY